MQFTLNENSLFAILLRSRWWISIGIGAGLSAVAVVLLPEAYRVAGYVTGAPFFVIGCMAAWRQWRAPSASRIEKTVVAVRAMAWPDFAQAMEQAWRREGYAVEPVTGSGADFEIRKDWRRCLVSCKRFKVARTGIEPLRELFAAKEALEAHDCLYVATGEVTDNARAFATRHSIKIVSGPELARLLPRSGGKGKTA
ncbi:MAG: restriction endonuclease [Burkholderiales bacterium]|nr:restriction endonuclease [Burkholderiales bacterium]